jgi:G6PDH family F420-dependent oxidoreductase
MRIGLFLSSEEFGPRELVDLAIRGERAGFAGLWISDHFHPWNDEQGHSPFVWSAIGAIAQATDLPLGTGVTCPTMRIHPAILAQAAATSAILLGGRFTFGVGSGEALNEHILGDRWPGADERLEMLEEAVEVMRKLWTGCTTPCSRPASTTFPRPRHPCTCPASGPRRSGSLRASARAS